MPLPIAEQKEEEQIVTYERLGEDDSSCSDYKRVLNEYVWQHLPLAPEQREAFLQLLHMEVGVDDGRGAGVYVDSMGDELA